MEKLLQTDISHGNYETYVPMLMEKFADVSKEEILQRVAATEFDRFLKYYENAEDLNIRDDRRTRITGASREPYGREQGRSREPRNELLGGGGKKCSIKNDQGDRRQNV